MNNQVGFNPEEIVQTIKELDAEYEGVLNCLTKDFEAKVIQKLADNWFAPEAVQFSEHVYSEMNELLERDIKLNYEGRMQTVITNSNKWAQEVGSDFRLHVERPSRLEFRLSNIAFSDNKNGFVGIYKENLQDVYIDISRCFEQATGYLRNMHSIINKHQTFLGANQVESWINKIDEWKSLVIEKMYDIGNEYRNKVKQTEEKYMQTAQTNAQRFSSGN